MCEAYVGLTPKDLEDLTLDQLRIMIIDKQMLKGAKRITGTPQQLAAQGLIPAMAGHVSFASRMREANEQKRLAQERRDKRTRRAERRQQLIDYQKQRGSLEG
jgi:hypothetical protein